MSFVAAAVGRFCYCDLRDVTPLFKKKVATATTTQQLDKQ